MAEPKETDSYFIESYHEGDEEMATVRIGLSRRASDGQYGSFEANIAIEDEVPAGTNQDSFEASLYSWCKAVLDRHMGDLREEYMAVSEAVGRPPEFVEGYEPETSDVPIPPPNVRRAEEKPPLPSDSPQKAPASPSGDSTGQKVQSTADDDYRKTFRIQSFEVAETATGDRYLKCFGKAAWKREWVPAWNDVAELLFGEIQDMDLGVIGPPYDLDAVVQMKDDEWRGKKYIAPDKIIEWEQVREE